MTHIRCRTGTPLAPPRRNDDGIGISKSLPARDQRLGRGFTRVYILFLSGLDGGRLHLFPAGDGPRGSFSALSVSTKSITLYGAHTMIISTSWRRVWRTMSRKILSSSNPKHTNQSFIRFNRIGDGLELSDLLDGPALITGDPGAGKTSAVVFLLLKRYWQHGASIVCTAVKPDDAGRKTRLLRAESSHDDVGIRVLRLGNNDGFNPLDYEAGRAQEPGLIDRITRLALLPLERQQYGGGTDPFWMASASKLVRYTVTVLVLARWRISFELLYRVATSLPADMESLEDPRWQLSCPLIEAFDDAFKRELTSIERGDLEAAARYFFETVPNIPHKTRSSTVETFTSAIDPLVHGEVGAFINAEQDSWTPDEVVVNRGAVVLDMPVQSSGPAGLIIQRLIVESVQRRVLARRPQELTHPVVIELDEYPSTVRADVDAEYSRTARSRMGTMILGIQSLASLREACRDARDQHAAASTLVGMCGTVFACATTDVETAEWISKLFAKRYKSRVSFGTQDQNDKQNGRRQNRNTQVTREFVHDVPADSISRLRRGGPENNYLVECFVASGSRVWRATGKRSIKIAIPQTLL